MITHLKHTPIFGVQWVGVNLSRTDTKEDMCLMTCTNFVNHYRFKNQRVYSLQRVK